MCSHLLKNGMKKPEHHYFVMFWSIGKILLVMIRNQLQDPLLRSLLHSNLFADHDPDR